jgi:nickel transport protein
VMDNGLWSKSPDGKFHNKGRDEVPNAVVSGRYYKYATHLRKLPAGALAPLPNLKFQIVPVGKSFPTKKGETLIVDVLFDGKPAVGAKVFQDGVTDPGGAHVVTGKNGRATFKVRNAGLNVLVAEFQSGPENPAVTLMTEHVATLSFMYDPPPE